MKTLIASALLLLTLGSIAPAAEAESPAFECVTVYDFPDMGYKLCMNLNNPDCTVWEVRTTFIGTETNCIVPAPVASTTSSTSPPPCYEIYSQNHLVGPYWLVRRDTCSAQVYSCPDGSSPPAPPCEEVGLSAEASTSAAAPAYEPQCLQYYSETSVGPVTRVSRDSCHSETYVCEDDDGVHEQDETLGAFLDRQVAEPGTEETQECVNDFLGEYVAWG